MLQRRLNFGQLELVDRQDLPRAFGAVRVSSAVRRRKAEDLRVELRQCGSMADADVPDAGSSEAAKKVCLVVCVEC